MTSGTNWIEEVWTTELYQTLKKENFENLDKFLQEKNIEPRNILDIGCGFAWESRLFYEKYGSNLWLIDGDSANNSTKSKNSRDDRFQLDANDFLFYYPLQKLDEELKNNDVKNYKLIDCNNIQIPDDVKFDLITSWISCGFHYPASTYRDLILKHSHPNTVVVMDLRVRAKEHFPILEEGVEILDILQRRRKYFTSFIRFV